MSSSYSDSDCNCDKCRNERHTHQRREKCKKPYKCEKCQRYEKYEKCEKNDKCEKCIKREKQPECINYCKDTENICYNTDNYTSNICNKIIPKNECNNNDKSCKYVVITINSFGQKEEISRV